MKLSELVANYRPSLKAKLKKSIKLSNGKTLKKGTLSDLIIKKNDNEYHFEANDTACTVTTDEITFI